MKTPKRDPKSLTLPVSSTNLPATVSGIHRNSPSRASIKIVLPPVVPSRNGFHDNNANSSKGVVRQMNSLDSHLFYDSNNYYTGTKPSMQQIPEQNPVALFDSYVQPLSDSCGVSDAERLSLASSTNDHLNQYNRYSSSSLDSGRGSDSVKLLAVNSSRISVHSCESVGSVSSNKESENSQQSSLSSSSSTSSSFCSSASSSSCSSALSYQNQHYNPSLSSTSNSSPLDITPASAADSNVFLKSKSGPHASAMRQSSSTSDNVQNLMAKAGPLSIAEMILHGVSDLEMIHIWLQKINMSKYEHNFVNAAYDMATIARMTPQDLTAIGITDPQARSTFTSEIQKIKIPEGIPDFIPNSLEEWLKLLNLNDYYHTLCQQGYSTIERVIELTWEDLEDFGINKLGHQKKILLAIKKIKSLMKSSKDADSNSIYAPLPIPRPEEIYVSQSAVGAVNRVMDSSSNSLPYQDVPIKMYASAKLNSPSQEQAPFEACSIIQQSNVLPSSLFNSKPPMRTFQQNEANQQAIDPYHNQTNMFSRRRSLESLNHPDANSYYGYYNNPNYLSYKPTYQYSSCDLYNRQTVYYENTASLNTFNNQNNQKNHSNFEIDGIATLNRPKNLIRSKPVAKIVANSRTPEAYDNYDSNSIGSVESYERAESSSDSSSIYSTFKKKPPPPPKRVNSMRKPTNSLPASPLHQSEKPIGPQYAGSMGTGNTLYSNNLCSYKEFYNDITLYNNQISSEDVFASCVKSLTNRFSEIHSLANKEDERQTPSSSDLSINAFTLPLNRKESRLTEANCHEQVNVSSSSSTESMPFANDNVGTIRQKSSAYLQNALKLSDSASRLSSPSSSTSTPSPLLNKNLSLPNSAVNSPSSTTASTFPSYTSSENSQKSLYSGNASKNVVDSLEHIEIMIANLKTQLDSIE